MPHLTSMERLAISDATCEGIHKGIQGLLKVLFGEEGLELMPEIRKIYQIESLEVILKTLQDRGSLDEVRQVTNHELQTIYAASCETLRGLIESGLKMYFGDEGLELMPAIQKIAVEEQLRAIHQNLHKAGSLEEVRRMCTPGSS